MATSKREGKLREMRDAIEKIESELEYEWRQLRQPNEWVPPMVDLSGYKALDIELLNEEMDRRSWGYYRAGQIKAYGEALDLLEEHGLEDEDEDTE